MKITRKVSLIISLFVGLVLGAVFTTLAMIMSPEGKIIVPGIIISALISMVISGIIGVIVSMKDFTDKIALKFGINPVTAKLKYNLLQALIGDLIFTPILCTFFFIKNALPSMPKNLPVPAYICAWGKTLLLDLAIAYVLTFFLCPLFKKLAAKILKLGDI